MSLTLTALDLPRLQALGAALGAAAHGPLLIALSGDYGAGKTTLVQAIAAGIGIAEPLRSPSYLLARAYTGGRCTLVHADLYRTGSLAEVADLALDELAGPEGIVAVEWPGEAAALALRGWPVLRLALAVEDAPGETRRIDAGWTADCPPGLLEVLRAAAA